jgi:hypothetical protein
MLVGLMGPQSTRDPVRETSAYHDKNSAVEQSVPRILLVACVPVIDKNWPLLACDN